MDPLMIPKACVIRGERVTIRYAGDISIENDLVPLSVKSEDGGIRFIPEGRSISCSHLSAENGMLEVDADKLDAEMLSAKNAILKIGVLQVAQSIQVAEDVAIESEEVKVQEMHVGTLEMTAADELEVDLIEASGDVEITLDSGRVRGIKGKRVVIKAGENFECDRISAQDEVVISSGQIAIKYVDAPRFIADPSVSGIVMLSSAKEVRAEGVRGFIRPNEFRMFSEQGPILALAQGEDGAGSGQAPEVIKGGDRDEVEPDSDAEVSDLDEGEQWSDDDGQGDDAEEAQALTPEPEPELDSSSGDASDADLGSDDSAAEDDELLVQPESPDEVKTLSVDEDEGNDDEGDHDEGDDDASQDVNVIEEEDEFMTREISDFAPDSAIFKNPVNASEDDVDEADDDDEILDIDVKSEEIEQLPEITDFDDFPEFSDASISMNESANSGPLDGVPTLEPIPVEEESDDLEGGDSNHAVHPPPIEDAGADEDVPPPLDQIAELSQEPPPIETQSPDAQVIEEQDLDASIHLEESMTYTPDEIDEILGDDDQADEDSREDLLVERLQSIIGEIKQCFPDENYPKFINQIQTYLGERRFSILRKRRNMEAVLSSFDRLNHDRISALARSFYDVLHNHFGDA